MAVNNSLAKANAQAPAHKSFTSFVTTDAAKNQIQKILGSGRGTEFVSNMVATVQANKELAECSNTSILSGGLQAHTLGLNLNPALGEAYLVPYNTKEGKLATFQVGYRGLLKLAIKSGVCSHIKAMSIKEGEIEGVDPFSDQLIGLKPILDPDERRKAATVGYVGEATLSPKFGGNRVFVYMTKNEAEDFAKEFSKGYNAKKGYTTWEKDFDAMAEKTVLKRLLKKVGYLSTDLSAAVTADQAVINADGTATYVDNTNETVQLPNEFAEPVVAETVENAEVISDEAADSSEKQ